VLASVLEIAESNSAQYRRTCGYSKSGFCICAPVPTRCQPSHVRLAIVMTGNRGQEFWERRRQQGQAAARFLSNSRGVIEAARSGFASGRARRIAPSKAAYLHPGKAATLVVGEREIGAFGVLHPKVAEQYGPRGAARCSSPNSTWRCCKRRHRPDSVYTPVPRLPGGVAPDIALVVDEGGFPRRELKPRFGPAGGALLRGHAAIRFVSRPTQIPAGTKSLAYALSYQADDRTLADKDIDKAHKKIEDRLKQNVEGPRSAGRPD